MATRTQKKITTQEYIDNLLNTKTGWKPRPNRKVSLTSKPKVANVQPFRKTGAGNSKAKNEMSTPTSTSTNVSIESQEASETQEQIDADRNIAEELQLSYMNEDSGILSLDPNFNSDDDMNNYPWDDPDAQPEDDNVEEEENDSGLQADEINAIPSDDVNVIVPQNEDTNDSTTLPDLPTSGDEEDNLISNINEVSEQEEYSQPSDDDDDDDQDDDEDVEEIDEVENNDIIEILQEESQMDTQSQPTSRYDVHPTFAAMNIVPLSLDFLDSLGQLYDEKKEGIYESFANVKLFDGKGLPITTESLLKENISTDKKETINKQNAVYMDVMKVNPTKVKKEKRVMAEVKQSKKLQGDIKRGQAITMGTEATDEVRKQKKENLQKYSNIIQLIEKKNPNKTNTENYQHVLKIDGKQLKEATENKTKQPKPIRYVLGISNPRSKEKEELTKDPDETIPKVLAESNMKNNWVKNICMKTQQMRDKTFQRAERAKMDAEKKKEIKKEYQNNEVVKNIDIKPDILEKNKIPNVVIEGKSYIKPGYKQNPPVIVKKHVTMKTVTAEKLARNPTSNVWKIQLEACTEEEKTENKRKIPDSALKIEDRNLEVVRYLTRSVMSNKGNQVINENARRLTSPDMNENIQETMNQGEEEDLEYFDKDLYEQGDLNEDYDDYDQDVSVGELLNWGRLCQKQARLAHT